MREGYPHIRHGPRGRGESENLTAGVSGKGGIWRTKSPDAESAVGADSLEGRAATARVRLHALLGSF